MKETIKSRAAITKLLDAINNENFDHTSTEANYVDLTYKIEKIPTEKCYPWRFANRMKEYINEDSCRDLIESIKSSSQRIPIIVRKNKEAYEVICGIRRLYSCSLLEIPVLAAIVNATDKEALLIMDVENRARIDISPYERAMDYKKWIDSGIYNSHKEIQELTGIKKSWFSQLMSLVELNSNIVKAFGNPINLKQKWGYQLRLLCKEKQNEEKVLKAIELIKDKRYQPRTIYSKLLQSCTNTHNRDYEKIIKNKDGTVLFTVKAKSKYTNIYINKSLEEDKTMKIIEEIQSLLE